MARLLPGRTDAMAGRPGRSSVCRFRSGPYEAGRGPSQYITASQVTAVLLSNPTAPIFNQSHVVRVLLASGRMRGRGITPPGGWQPPAGRCTAVWTCEEANAGGRVAAAHALGGR